MSESSPTYLEQLATLLWTIAYYEKECELARIALNSREYFHLESAFRCISSSDAITFADLCQFLDENKIEFTELDADEIINYHTKGLHSMNFDSFCNMVVTQTREDLINKMLSRKVTQRDGDLRVSIGEFMKKELKFVHVVENLRIKLFAGNNLNATFLFYQIDRDEHGNLNYNSLTKFCSRYNLTFTAADYDALLRRAFNRQSDYLPFHQFQDLVCPYGKLPEAAVFSSNFNRIGNISPNKLSTNIGSTNNYSSGAKKINDNQQFNSVNQNQISFGNFGPNNNQYQSEIEKKSAVFGNLNSQNYGLGSTNVDTRFQKTDGLHFENGNAWDAVIKPHLDKHSQMIMNKYSYLLDQQGEFDISSSWMNSSPTKDVSTVSRFTKESSEKKAGSQNNKNSSPQKNNSSPQKLSREDPQKKAANYYTPTKSGIRNSEEKKSSPSYKSSSTPGGSLLDPEPTKWINGFVDNVFYKTAGPGEVNKLSPYKKDVGESQVAQYNQRKLLRFRYLPYGSNQNLNNDLNYNDDDNLGENKFGEPETGKIDLKLYQSAQGVNNLLHSVLGANIPEN